MGELQQAGDAVADAWGLPHWRQRIGYNLRSFSLRLGRRHRADSPKHKNVDLPSIGDKRALVNIVDEIFADTAKAARDDTGVQAGTLRGVVEVGQSGRRISRFYGSPSTTLAPWMVPVFRVRKIRRNPDRNYDE